MNARQRRAVRRHHDHSFVAVGLALREFDAQVRAGVARSFAVSAPLLKPNPNGVIFGTCELSIAGVTVGHVTDLSMNRRHESA